MRKRPTILAVVMLVASMAAGAPKKPVRRPNILILHADQWRAQATGYSGDKDVKTPNIDRLAADSANMKNAVSSLPVCTPSRASLMTGQGPLTNGVFMNDIRLDPKAVTLAEVLAGVGYHTGYIGKWHLDGNYRLSFTPPGPRRQGFQYWKALNCSHNYNHSAYYTGNDPTRHYWKGYDVFAEAQDARRYISDHAKDSAPFFLMVAWGPPHSPYGTAPEQYKAMYDPSKLTLRPNVPKDGCEAARKKTAGYYAHISAIDDALGGIIATLKKQGIYDNTIVIFTSDHGDLLGSHGIYGKQAPYDESIRIPFLVHDSGKKSVKKGTRKAMFECVDIMPTILGLAGVPVPSSVEGKDFSKYLRGGDNPKKGENVADILSIYPFSSSWGIHTGGRSYRGIRTRRYTYARDLKGPWILFDNQADPYQMHNLVDDPGSAKIKKRLDALLEKRLKKHHDRFLPGLDYVKAYHYPKLGKNGAVPYFRK